MNHQQHVSAALIKQAISGWSVADFGTDVMPFAGTTKQLVRGAGDASHGDWKAGFGHLGTGLLSAVVDLAIMKHLYPFIKVKDVPRVWTAYSALHAPLTAAGLYAGKKVEQQAAKTVDSVPIKRAWSNWDTADTVTDFVPVVGGVKDMGKGVYDMAQGNWGKGLGNLGMGAASLGLDALTFGGASLAKGALKTLGKGGLRAAGNYWGKGLAEQGGKQLAKNLGATVAVNAGLEGGGRLLDGGQQQPAAIAEPAWQQQQQSVPWQIPEQKPADYVSPPVN